jgi:uncharacterized protein YlzI (FlbEa/FlbD family)
MEIIKNSILEEEKVIYKRLIENLNDYSLSKEKGKKFIMNSNLFKLLRENVEKFLPFDIETKREVLTKKHIYGYYTRIPIVVDKKLMDDFLLVKVERQSPIVIDLRISQFEKDKNQGIFLLQDFIEHIRNFPNLALGMAKGTNETSCNLLHSKENLLIGKVTLFNRDVEEYYKPKSERIVWEYNSLKVEKVLEEIKTHKKHTHKIDVDPFRSAFQLICFDCRTIFNTVKLLTKEDWKRIPKKYHYKINRGYTFKKG